MEFNVFFAELSWWLLIVILYSRPLADIFQKKFFIYIVCKRKILGILCGLSALLHVLIFLTASGHLADFLLDSSFWSPNSFFGWGSLALVAMLFPFLTSNRFSQKFLKGKWKNFQRLAYVAFIFTGIHLSMLKGSWLVGFLPVLIWAGLWFWAEKRSDGEIDRKCST